MYRSLGCLTKDSRLWSTTMDTLPVMDYLNILVGGTRNWSCDPDRWSYFEVLASLTKMGYISGVVVLRRCSICCLMTMVQLIW